MNVYWVAGVSPNGTFTPEQEKAFREATTIFVGAILSVIGDKLVDAYLHMRNAKELSDALEAKFGAIDAGSELYAMEQFHDYRMVDNRSVVVQAHEIQCIAKKLKLLKCVLPDKFVAGCIIAKLPPSWRKIATFLKHQRQEISVENLIGSLGVEENARSKDSHMKKVEVPIWYRKIPTSSRERMRYRPPTSRRRRITRVRPRTKMAVALSVMNLGTGLLGAHNAKAGSQDITLSLST